jgi:hypothetical protein
MNFGSYLLQLVRIIFSSSLALGLLLGIAIFIGGETTAEMDLTLDFESIDGIWMILGLPVLFLLVFLLLSPISFFIHAVLSGSYRKKN